MTAQAPDRLQYDGKTFHVYEFIDLPPGVVLPPEEMLCGGTAHWRGYTARWEIREQDGRLQLYMLGFQCVEYLPLCTPYLNPITGTVRVVPDGAELLHGENMGFQSKYAGELNFRFIGGELVGIEPIPDDRRPQDGLLDLAELGPGGKEGYLDQLRQPLKNYVPTPIPPDVRAMLEEDESTPRRNVPCSACRAIVPEAPPRLVGEFFCRGCGERLLAIGRQLRHWHARLSPYGGTVGLNQRRDADDPLLLDPDWHARTMLDPFGSLGFDGTERRVRLRIRGRPSLRSRIVIPAAGDEEARHEHRSSVLSAVSRRLEQCLEPHGGTQVRTSYASGITVTVRCEMIVTAETHRNDVPLPDGEIAAVLLEKLEAAIERWHSDLAHIDRVLHREVPAIVGGMSTQADIDITGEPTATDREILDWVTPGNRRRHERVWAVLPAHTPQGWLPGETVAERYRKSLNL